MANTSSPSVSPPPAALEAVSTAAAASTAASTATATATDTTTTTTRAASASARPAPPPPAQPSVKKACDNCRLRKTRCNLANPCTNCASRGFECTYATPHRKRGPAGRRLNEIREREQQRSKAPEASSTLTPPPPVPAASGHGLAITANPDAAPGPLQYQQHPSEDHHHHQQQQQQQDQQPQQFVFVRNNSGPVQGPGPEKPMNAPVSWDGLLHTFDANSPALDQPGPTSPSVGRPASTRSGPFDETLFSMSNISNQTPFGHELSVAGGAYAITPLSRPSPSSSSNDLWPPAVTDENLVRWLDIYFDRLYPTLPILKRSAVFARLMDREHRRNPDFGAMLLSLSGFALIQPVRLTEQKLSSHSREQMVSLLLNEAVKMRTVVDFGQAPTLDTIFTSVFLFACLFQKGQHNAAWLRLRESVELGALFGLDKFDSYVNCEHEQKQQRLRVYYLLAVTERAYSIERHHSIGFLGHPSVDTASILESISSPADSVDCSGIVIHDDVEATCMLGLVQLIRLFDAIDEDFVRCWNNQCRNDRGGCRFLDEQTAIRIHNQINSSSPTTNTYAAAESSASEARPPAAPPGHMHGAAMPGWLASARLTPAQETDILINQQWLQNRLWHVCLSHKLLIPESEHRVLCIYNAITIAEDTLRVCQQMALTSIEVHGIGMIEKIYTIVESAIAAIRHLETAERESKEISNTVGPSPTFASGSLPYSEGLRSRAESISENDGGSPGPGHMRHHQTMLLGFLRLFKTIRAGEHVYLERYTTLVGQDLET